MAVALSRQQHRTRDLSGYGLRVSQQEKDAAVAVLCGGESLVEVAPQPLVVEREEQSSHREGSRELPATDPERRPIESRHESRELRPRVAGACVPARASRAAV